jgi:Asp-tRNA(Asn)/Glu-tRNA(Gln) amidotransferase A subunit family amidase
VRFLLSPSSGTDGGRPIANANEFSAREGAAQIASGRLTSEALVRTCLARIEAREPDIQAWEFLDAA